MKKLALLIGLVILSVASSCSGDDDYVPIQNDDQNPTAPQNLIATAIGINSIELSWDASTDNVGVIGYDIYSNGELVITGVSGTTATLNNLDPETTYAIYVIALDEEENESPTSNILSVVTEGNPLEFKMLLSEMGVFQGNLKDLDPANRVQLYEINSTLFTDNAIKQRLIKLPLGRKMEYNNSNLQPIFPNNTLIAKTFYYNENDQNPSQGKIIIETRILIKLEEGWKVGNYIWNSAQTDAQLRDTGSEIPISYIDINGDTQTINYLIPSKQDCFSCHNSEDSPIPIGMKLRNMNFVPSYTSNNQLDHFTDIGFLSGLPGSSQISVLPDWQDNSTYTLSERARAYIDINCAHCHSPGSSIPQIYNLDLRYEIDFAESGIFDARFEIEARFASTTPLYRMPLLGRTIVHEEALQLISDYVNSL